MYLPTHRAGPDIQGDRIRLRNLIAQAEIELSNWGLRTPEVRTILSPMESLVDDHRYWQGQLDGLAIFRTNELVIDLQLPISVEEWISVQDRFYVRPLLPLVTRDESFHILGLDIKRVRLWNASRYSIQEVKLEGFPTSLEEALRFDDPERQLQFHTGTSAPHGDRSAAYHGHGAPKDDAKDDILRFFHQVDLGITPHLKDRLVLVGVEYLIPIYREANSYPKLMEEAVPRDVKNMRERDLKDASWQRIRPLLDQNLEEALDGYWTARKEARASDDLSEIVPASCIGRVEKLFLCNEVHFWGSFDHDLQRVDLHADRRSDSEELLNLAACCCLSCQGEVYTLPRQEMPGEAFVAAMNRY
jgi:hypothetical protein